MSLLEEARGINARTTKGPECSVIRASRLNPEQADDIAAVIRDRSVSGGAAEVAFRNHRIDITKITVERHRRNQCTTCRVAGVVW